MRTYTFYAGALRPLEGSAVDLERLRPAETAITDVSLKGSLWLQRVNVQKYRETTRLAYAEMFLVVGGHIFKTKHSEKVHFFPFFL